MKVAFTGTRKGMTTAQWSRVASILTTQFANGSRHEWHNGDAIGADAQSHASVLGLKKMGRLIETHGHPCNKEDQREYMDFDVMHEVAPPLSRNRDMVRASGLLVAAPFEYEDIPRGSGTWATIRFAARTETSHIVVWPDGSDTTFDYGTHALY